MIRKLLLVASGFLIGAFVTITIPVSFSKPEATAPFAIDDLRKFTTTLELIRKVYVHPVTDEKLITNAISGMVSNLDPHSSYLDEEALTEIQIQTAGKFGGLGIEISMDEDGFVKVISPIEGSPAEVAGIKAGDVIIKIDDMSVRGMKLSDAINRMRGTPKTKVTLTISRTVASTQEVLTFTIIRDIINVTSVKSKMLESGIAYLRLTQFQETTISMMVEQLNKLAQQGTVKGLVLDLRNNPGGTFEASIGVSAAFLEKGQVVVSTDGRVPDVKSVMTADPEHYLYRRTDADPLVKLDTVYQRVPIVVLVNSGSASASEIVAGALQDHRRALIIGTKTFGKGSVQRLLPLINNTAVKLTVALYFTPNKNSIQAEGITPDIIVEDPSVRTNLTIREADLQHHIDKPQNSDEKLSSESKSNQEKPADASQETLEADSNVICRPIDRPRPVRLGEPEDYLLQRAIEYLKTPGQFDKKGRPII